MCALCLSTLLSKLLVLLPKPSFFFLNPKYSNTQKKKRNVCFFLKYETKKNYAKKKGEKFLSKINHRSIIDARDEEENVTTEDDDDETTTSRTTQT